MFKTRDTRRLYAGDSPRLCTVIRSSGPRKTKSVSVFLTRLDFPVICIFKFRCFEIKMIGLCVIKEHHPDTFFTISAPFRGLFLNYSSKISILKRKVLFWSFWSQAVIFYLPLFGLHLDGKHCYCNIAEG